MLMLGKMSTGVRAIAKGPTIKMSRASTTNVYGRRSAIRTIHIDSTILTPGPGDVATACHATAAAKIVGWNQAARARESWRAREPPRLAAMDVWEPSMSLRHVAKATAAKLWNALLVPGEFLGADIGVGHRLRLQ